MLLSPESSPRQRAQALEALSLENHPQGSEARLSCCSTDSHQMEPLPACGDSGPFRLAWGASGEKRSRLLVSAFSAGSETGLPSQPENHLREN